MCIVQIAPQPAREIRFFWPKESLYQIEVIQNICGEGGQGAEIDLGYYFSFQLGLMVGVHEFKDWIDLGFNVISAIH